MRFSGNGSAGNLASLTLLKSEKVFDSLQPPDMRWLLTIFIALIVLLTCIPWLSKLGLGRLPGDINFRIGRFPIRLPIASTILILVGAYLFGRLI